MSKPIEGSVARVEDQYTLIINRGSEHGVTEGMEFAVMADEGDAIVDPETGEVIGELPTEKLQIRVSEVHEKWSRAETFVHYQPAPVDLGKMAGIAGITVADSFKLPEIAGFADIGGSLSEKLAASGVYESISESVRREMTNPRPVRQQIANPKPQPPKKQPVRREVTVNIGDRVRQIMPEPKRSRQGANRRGQ